MFEKMGGEVWDDFWETVEYDFSKEYRQNVDLREIYMIQVPIFLKYVARDRTNPNNLKKTFLSRFTNNKPVCVFGILQ